MLKLVKANNGVVMVNFYSGFVMPEGARATKDMFAAYNRLRKQYAEDGKQFRAAMAA